MSMDKMKIEVLLAAINNATGPLKAIQTGSNETAKALKATKDQLRELNKAQGNISAFQKVSKDAAITANTLKTAQDEVKRIKQEIDKVPAPTRDMARAFQQAKDQASKLKEEHNKLIERQQRLRDTLKGTGIETSNLGDHQRELRSKMASATSDIEKQAKALETLNQRQKTLNRARAAYDKSMEHRNKLAGAGASTTAAGAAMGVPILKAIKDYASFEDAMMGVARQVDGAKDANGRYTQTYYEMGDAIKAMAERMPLATTEIAAIIEAGARMGIQGKENLLTYAQTTAVMATAFDLPVDQVGEDVAKIAALYKVPIKSINELGDVINYLDDNALAKGGDIIDVMKRIAGTADTVGMKYKDAAALASTFLSLGANSEVAGSASNAIMTNLSIATMQADRFQDGLAMLKMNAASVQKGMSTNATGTILKVIDAIKSLPQEKQLEATTRLFGKEFGDDAAKLASNVAEYRKQLELTKAAQAAGSMDREAQSRNQAMSAQYVMMKNTVFDLSSELGQSLKPATVEIMQSVSGVLREVRDWTKANPELTSALMKGAAVLAFIVITLGALMLGVASVLGPLALLRLAIAWFGMGGLAALGPFGLAVIGLATAATLIYKNWEPIKEFFSNLWDGITERFNIALTWIKDKFSFLKPILELISSPAKLALAATVGTTSAAGAQPVSIDKRPPITAAMAKLASTHTFAPTLHINASPGMNEQQLAQLVAKEMERLQRQQATRNRSRLTDSE